jgi:hypothetical protein
LDEEKTLKEAVAIKEEVATQKPMISSVTFKKV